MSFRPWARRRCRLLMGHHPVPLHTRQKGLPGWTLGKAFLPQLVWSQAVARPSPSE